MKIRSIFSSTTTWLVMRAKNTWKYFRHTSAKTIFTDFLAFMLFLALITSPVWNIALFLYFWNKTQT